MMMMMMMDGMMGLVQIGRDVTVESGVGVGELERRC